MTSRAGRTCLGANAQASATAGSVAASSTHRIHVAGPAMHAAVSQHAIIDR